ncbi:MAG TPA: lytic murein transglycosylase [Solirubrobacterales bacterium]|jgi:hypothetical protein
MDPENRTARGNRLHLCWVLALALALTAFAGSSASAAAPASSASSETVAECVESADEEGLECEYLVPPAPEVSGPEASGKGGSSGIGAAAAVPGGGPVEPAESVPTPSTPATESGEAPAAESGEAAEPAPKRGEVLVSPAEPPEAANGGTSALSPKSLQASKKAGSETETTSRHRTAAIPGGPLPVGGLAGASTLPLGQIELPPLLLPVYQACGTTYDVPWEVLASINKIESDFGSNMGPSSAGAIGPMQFMPATWSEDGLDADGDGVADAWDPFDAICAAAKYLHEAGAPADLHGAIFAYNHADWYVEEVLREARNFEALPENMLASITALAEGETTPAPDATGYGELTAPSAVARIPIWVGVPTLFADESQGSSGGGGEASAGGPAAAVSAPAGSPVTAVADATVLARGNSDELGNYLILRDQYGARYTYSELGPLRRKVRSGTRHPKVALRKGTKVRAGTVLATVAAGESAPAGFDFALQPDGSAPIAPIQFLRAWKRGGVGGIYLDPRHLGEAPAAGKNATDGAAAENPAMFLVAGEARLRSRALHGRLLDLPRCLRKRIAAGRLAPRALAGVEFLAAESGERVGLSAAACAGEDRFKPQVTSIGGTPIGGKGAVAKTAALVDSARRMEGAMGPQRVHGPTLGAAAEPSAASRPRASAAVARIASSPAGPEPAREPLPASLELDFLPPQSAFLQGADAVAPIDAPGAVQEMVAAADQINQTPYIWGGGHGAWVSAGYDCSGSVSYVLHAAGLLSTPETSGSLESFGAPGPGRWVTIYANAEHTYMEIAGLRWDTVGDAQGSGPRWHLEPPYPEGFVIRHPIGL